ncbi:peptidoglycan-binding domain-containing protein [Streptomyces sp. NPDC006544]|uniref:peptidoglycan-binding domain-containing protein n=1 Tax=Streptomyces sp. NPDC006544 TaxID=3154583 RepID=UPI0033A25F08
MPEPPLTRLEPHRPRQAAGEDEPTDHAGAEADTGSDPGAERSAGPWAGTGDEARDEARAGRSERGRSGRQGPAGVARGRRVVLGVVGGAALMAVGGLLTTTWVRSPAQVVADTAPPAQGALTAEVERRVLAETVVMRGTVVADQSVSVSPQGIRTPGSDGAGAGAAVVTKLPLKAGDPVRAGQLLAEVSGRPVFALHGGLPMYRDLKPGATGDDVAQLQQALRELGHDTGADATGVFGSGTKAALAARYHAVGYAPLPAVADGGTSLKAAREAVRSAQWAVEDAEAVVAGGGAGGGAGGAGSGASTGPAGATAPGGRGSAESGGTGSSGATGSIGGTGSAGGSTASGATAGAGIGVAAATAGPGAGAGGAGGSVDAGARRALDRARQSLVEARAALAVAEAADGPMLPAAETVFLGGFPARVSAVSARIGAPVSGPVLTLSAGELVVEAYLKDDRKQLLRAGMTVVISSELAGSDTRAKVVSVATERSSAPPSGPQQGQGQGQGQVPGQVPGSGGGGAGGGGADLGYRMVVRPDQPLPASFAGQDVRLTIESAATDGEALVVPVTAVSAGADGRTVVTAVAADGAQRRIEVRTGTTGDGFVAVTPVEPGSLAPGTKVVTGVARKGTPG